MNQLRVELKSKKFGKREILADIEFTCTTGEVVGFFGRNGSGKSTLLKLIFGILKEKSMSVQINQVEIPQNQIISSKTIAYLPQENFLPAGSTVRELIPLFYGSGQEQDRIFYAPGIAKMENTKIGNLSTGELRYFQFLLIAHMDHPFLMLDEPFSMIEPLYVEKIKEIIVKLKPTKGILISDHYYSDVLDVTNRNFIINDARLFPANTARDLFEQNYLKTM